MAWSTPNSSRAAGYVVLAADWNELADDLKYLKGQAGIITFEAAGSVQASFTINDNLTVTGGDAAGSLHLLVGPAATPGAPLQTTENRIVAINSGVDATGEPSVQFFRNGTRQGRIGISSVNNAISGAGSDDMFIINRRGLAISASNGGSLQYYFHPTVGRLSIGGPDNNNNVGRGLAINSAGQGSAGFGNGNDFIAIGRTTPHAYTAMTDDNTFFRVTLSSIAGTTTPQVDGFGLANAGIIIGGFPANTINTHTTAAVGPVTLDGYAAAGGGTTATVSSVSADGNLVVMRDKDQARFIFDASGASWEDTGTAWTNFDEFDDLKMVDTLAHSLARAGDPLKAQFQGWMAEHRQALSDNRIVAFNDDGHHFVSSRLNMLLVGAVRQLGSKIGSLEARLAMSAI